LTQKTDSFVQQNFRWNFSVNVLDNMLYVLAVSFISRETIMPLLVSSLTDSKIAIGLILAIHSIAYYLPQLFVANRAEAMKRKLPFVLVISGLLQRIPFLLIGLSILFFAQESPTIALILFFLLTGASAFGGGVVTPAWFSMIGKIIPVQRRGMFWGLSDGLGLMVGFVGAFFVGITLNVVAYPLNFAMLFLIASIIMVFSWGALALTREPESPIVKHEVSIRHYFKQLPTILRYNQNYRRFMISYTFNRISMMAVGFYIVYGNDNLNLSGTDVGTLTAVLIGSQAIMQLILGWVGDRSGHKLNLTLSAFVLALAAVVAIMATDLLTLSLAFMLLGTAIASDNISKFTIILEFSAPEDQPTFIGLTNTLLAPVTFLAPIIGGLIATIINFEGMFIVSMLCGLIGGLLLLFWVQEPRHTQPQPIQNSENI
jgi:MFS family permease